MRVALYVRVSSDAQDVSLSIGAQLRALREYADRNGHTIVREYVDEAESGRSTARPAFREMIALAKTKDPPFEMVLVWKLNRFSRSRVDSITFKELLRKRCIEVVSINEPLEDNPSGKLLEGIIESIDEFYSANLGQDIKRGLREAAMRGFFVGRLPPDGYHKVVMMDGTKSRRKLEPDSDDSRSVMAVRLAFSLAMQGLGTKEIAKSLNRDGFRTSTGSLWTKTYVYKVLTNEAYCGTMVLGGKNRRKASRSDDSPVRVENAWPGIIDRETFLSVQRKMASRRPKTVHPRILPSFYLLSGLLFCGCGRAMIGRSAKSHRYYYYTCNSKFKEGADSCHARSLPKKQLEGIVIEHIKTKILDDAALEKLVAMVNEDLGKTDSSCHERLDIIDAEVKDISSRLAALYDALETGMLDIGDLAPRIKELKAKQDELLKSRVLVEADMTLHGSHHIDAEQVKMYCNDLRSLLAEADSVKSKSFLRSFVEKIAINGSTCTVYYKLPVPAHWRENDELVLPTEPLTGPWGTISRIENSSIAELSVGRGSVYLTVILSSSVSMLLMNDLRKAFRSNSPSVSRNSRNS